MYFTAQPTAIPALLRNLQGLGYTVVGPSLSEGVVRLREIDDAGDLAAGILDEHAPGRYTVASGSRLMFASVNGPDSPKKFLHPAEVEIQRLAEADRGFKEVSRFHSQKKYAFVGIRPCDLKGVEVMDRTMMAPGFEDPVYSSFRKDSVFVVVNCTRSGSNCFCTTMGTGPEAESGYDVAITELPDKLILDVPEKSIGLLRGVDATPASEDDVREGREAVARARDQMNRRFERENLSAKMGEGMDSSVWGQAAERCLACGNCSLVCPTCFCNSLQDREDLAEGTVSRVRVWDSCLSKEFTYSAGGNPRQQKLARYRQFVMHKFAYWPEQFGPYGCVGCGRCVTWCPVGIDITATVSGVLKGSGGQGVKSNV
jgi:ferredoxin